MTSALSAPPSPPSAPPRAEALRRAYIEEELARMARIEAMALDIAETIWRRATGAADPAPNEAAPATESTPSPVPPAFGDDLSQAFHRAARAARLTCAVRGRLIDELERLEVREAEAGAQSAEARRAAAETREAACERIVARVAHAEHPHTPERVERLVAEARESLREHDGWEDEAEPSVGGLVARVCRDLGLSPDWPRLAEEAWIAEGEARTALAKGGGETLRVVFVDPAHGPPPSRLPPHLPSPLAGEGVGAADG